MAEGESAAALEAYITEQLAEQQLVVASDDVSPILPPNFN
jgi:hypothetical protein